MTIGQLEEMINNKPKHLSWEEWKTTEVLIPMNDMFDGLFFSPCEHESGYAELPTDDENEKPDTFILVPCGFFDIDEDEVNPELN